MSLRKTAVATALIATLGAGVLPAVSQAATTTKTPTITKHYSVATGAILANGKRTVPVTVTVTNPENSVSSWWSKKSVGDAVEYATTANLRKPFRVDGYRCVPTFPDGLNGKTTNFTCKLRGGDVATAVTLKFSTTLTVPINTLVS